MTRIYMEKKKKKKKKKKASSFSLGGEGGGGGDAKRLSRRPREGYRNGFLRAR